MRRIALYFLIVLLIPLSLGCAARKNEVTQVIEVPSAGAEEEMAEDEPNVESLEPQLAELETIAEEEVPTEQRAVYEAALGGQELVYYEKAAAEAVPHGPKDVIGDYIAKPPVRVSDFEWQQGEKWTIFIGEVYGVRASLAENGNCYALAKVGSVLNGSLTQTDLVIEEMWDLTLDDEMKGDHFSTALNFHPRLVNDQPKLFMLLSVDGGKTYQQKGYTVNLPEDYKEFDDAYVTELLDYYRGKNYTSSAKDPTTTENNELIYQYDFNRYAAYADYTDEQMMELLDDHLLVQIALRYKIKIRPQDNSKLSTFIPR